VRFLKTGKPENASKYPYRALSFNSGFGLSTAGGIANFSAACRLRSLTGGCIEG
jgi:hypothetical protein